MKIFGACSPENYLTDKGDCIACTAPGYFRSGLSDGSGQCYYCGDFCKSCLNETSCEVCQKDYYLDIKNNNKCSDCTQQGSYKNGPTDGSGKCLICLKGCAECDNSLTCKTCVSGFFLNSEKTLCLECMSNCSKCSSSIACNLCNNSFYLLSNNTCSDCSHSGGLKSGLSDGSGLCKSCISNCKACKDEITCDTCVNGFYSDKGQCKLCATDQYTASFSNGSQSCEPCPSKCEK